MSHYLESDSSHVVFLNSVQYSKRGCYIKALVYCSCVQRPTSFACQRPDVMWCWYVIVNRQSADGFDYNKLYGPPAAPEQTIRTSAVKKAFNDKDLWNQGPRITGIQRITLIVGTAIFLIDSGMIPQDDSKLYILVLRNFITLGRKFLIIFFLPLV